MNGVKKLKSESNELPDCVISHIFSKLGLKNLVKTSALSKQWYHEWGLRKDLTFDLHNMFDYNTMPVLPITLPLLQEAQSQFATRLDNFMQKYPDLHDLRNMLDYDTVLESPISLPHFQQLQSQFATRLDYFMQKYPGDMISSIRINFPLGVDHTDAIDGLIHKGLVKGANRIELLFAYETDLKFEPYKFLFPFLSGPNSLTYLHLQNCSIAATMEFSGLKNLRTLVLDLVTVEQNMLQDLCFNCIHLENFTLNQCLFLSDLKITSTALLHLNINCGLIIDRKINIDIIASNLSSIEYSSNSFSRIALHTVNIKSHKLSEFSYTCTNISNLVEFSVLKNVTTIVLDKLMEGDVLTHLFSNCLQLEHVTIKMCRFACGFKIISAKLRHLSIVRCYYSDVRCKMDIHALNLSSFEFRCFPEMRSQISLETPKLLKAFWDAGFNKINIYNFATLARFHHVENFAMHMSFSHVKNFPMHMSLSQISKLMKEYLDQYQNLRQLELYIGGAYNPNMDYFWILDIAKTSQHLQKLSRKLKMEIRKYHQI